MGPMRDGRLMCSGTCRGRGSERLARSAHATDAVHGAWGEEKPGTDNSSWEEGGIRGDFFIVNTF